MIVAFSTSSPLTSVALIEPTGEVIACKTKEAPKAASSACLALLDECLATSPKGLDQATLFVADIGPGSFTGTRVGVIMAKTMAYDRGCQCAGATSFDLIDPIGDAYVPSKKGEWLLREVGEEPICVTVVAPSIVRGYMKEGCPPDYPLASRFALLLDRLVPVQPEALMPYYFHEPSISKPNKPYRTVGGAR